MRGPPSGGSSEDLFIRSCAISRKDLLEEFSRSFTQDLLIEGSLEVKLPTIWTDEKQSREEAERRERSEERRVEEKE